jgi:hypothetical protein
MRRTVDVGRKFASVAVLGTAIVLVGSLGIASAATGGTFILGKTNFARTTTVLKDSTGVPLSLFAPAGKAPLTVNRGVKVANLNADKLDGLDSTQFQRKLPQLVWHKLTLVNNWVNFNGTARPPAWARDAQGVIHFRGAIMETANTNAQFTTLPASIRPAVALWLVTDLLNAAPGRIDIATSGVVTVEAATNAAAARGLTNLDGITYSLH